MRLIVLSWLCKLDNLEAGFIYKEKEDIDKKKGYGNY